MGRGSPPFQEAVNGSPMRRTTVFLPEHLRAELALRGGSALLRTLIEEALRKQGEWHTKSARAPATRQI